MRTIGSVGGSKSLQSFTANNAWRTCSVCGKTFRCGEQWRYAHKNSHGGRVYYCSYTCFRVWDRKQREKAKQKIELENERYEKYLAYMHEYARRKQEKKLETKRDEKAIRKKRIQQCEERIAYFTALAEEHPKGSRARKTAKGNASRWRSELKRCQREEEAHGTHDGQPEKACAGKPRTCASYTQTVRD